MEHFKVKVTATYEQTFNVKAENEEAAKAAMQQNLDDGNIEMERDDLIESVKISPSRCCSFEKTSTCEDDDMHIIDE